MPEVCWRSWGDIVALLACLLENTVGDCFPTADYQADGLADLAAAG